MGRRSTARTILQTALVLQLIGYTVAIGSGFSGPAYTVALCVVLGTGVVEIVMGLLSKREDALND